MTTVNISKQALSPEQFLYVSDYLNDIFQKIQNKNKLFSLRSFALKLKYKNPSLLSDVLKKKRKPNHDLINKITYAFNLSKFSKDYLMLICDLETSKLHTEKEQILSKIRVLLSKRSWKYIDLDYLAFLTNWETMLIYNMMGIKNFEMTQKFINTRSRRLISQKTINASVKVLLKLNYIKQVSKGKYEYSHPNSVMAVGDDGVKTQAITTFHSQVLKYVLDVFPQLEYGEKDVRSTVMAISKKDIPQVLEIIKEAHDKVMSLGLDKDGDEVFLFSSQWLPMTKEI